jgi:peptidoglycan/xylan/chitin deacetylase (PgdA/CDA1 family)
MIVGLGVGAALIGGAAHGAFHRNSPLFGRPITHAPGAPGERVVSLTFDDGPNPDATPPILDALAARGMPSGGRRS